MEKPYAHYFKSGKQCFVIITITMQPIGGTAIKVSGKAEARKVAKAYDATPWNF